MKLAIIFLLAVLVSGCAGCSTPVLGSCPMPEAINYEARKPAVLTQKKRELHLQEEAAIRYEHGLLADDYNALRGYVLEHCQ